MAGSRHNRSRRALLGAGEAGCARAERRRWARGLAAYRRAEARVAAFRAAEAGLPAAERAYPACERLEAEYGRLESLRVAALRRLLLLPAPEGRALARKIALIVDDQAWELAGADAFLARLKADAGRLLG
jgi:hypothetical protein